MFSRIVTQCSCEVVADDPETWVSPHLAYVPEDCNYEPPLLEIFVALYSRAGSLDGFLIDHLVVVGKSLTDVSSSGLCLSSTTFSQRVETGCTWWWITRDASERTTFR